VRLVIDRLRHSITLGGILCGSLSLVVGSIVCLHDIALRLGWWRSTSAHPHLLDFIASVFFGHAAFLIMALPGGLPSPSAWMWMQLGIGTVLNAVIGAAIGALYWAAWQLVKTIRSKNSRTAAS
jgi:hypothetical protein